MTENTVFVLDSNVFIEAAKRYYAFDIAPQFWNSLIDHASNNSICSIDKIKVELERCKDELSVWAKNIFGDYFNSTNDNEVIDCYSQIMKWVEREPQYNDRAKNKIAEYENADAWLVAFAMAKGYCVVTHEVPGPDAIKNIPIPNVCDAFDVPYVNTFQMMRALKVKFS